MTVLLITRSLESVETGLGHLNCNASNSIVRPEVCLKNVTMTIEVQSE